MANDLYYNSVAVLLHGDGTNGSTTFTDNGPSARAMTGSGNAQISTAQSVFGTGSILLDGTGDYITTPSHADFNFGTGDFTIEAWIRPAAFSGDQVIAARFTTWSTSVGFYFGTRAGSPNILIFRGGDSLPITLNGNTALSTGTWYHVAVSRVSGVTRMFVNGVAQTATHTGSVNITSTSALAIGAGPATFNENFNGYIDDLRITKSVGRYSADFAVPTAAFPDAVEVGIGIATLRAPSPSLRFYAGATARVTAPSPSVAGYFGATAQLTSPSPALAGTFGAHVALVAPSTTVRATGHNAEGERSFTGRAPSARLSANGGGNARGTAPSARLVSTGTGTVIGRAYLAAPAIQLSATGMGGGIAAASLSGPRPSLRGYFGGVVSVTIGRATLAATGTSGAAGSARLRAPLFDLVARGTAQAHGSASLIAPSPRMGVTAQGWLIAPHARLVAVGHAVVTATYEAYALNLKHEQPKPGEVVVDELTHYTNYPFQRIVRWQNSYFGMAGDALYLLEGTTDYATPTPLPIEWSWKTCITDFGTSDKKTPESMYMAGRIGAEATVTLYVGEAGTEVHEYSTPRGADAQNYRQKFGRGVKGRYFAFGATGEGELALDDLEFSVGSMTRKV